jgi:hypothetical protein
VVLAVTAWIAVVDKAAEADVDRMSHDGPRMLQAPVSLVAHDALESQAAVALAQPGIEDLASGRSSGAVRYFPAESLQRPELFCGIRVALSSRCQLCAWLAEVEQASARSKQLSKHCDTSPSRAIHRIVM